MEQQTILVIDDTPENIDILSGTLRNDFKVKAATSGERALKSACVKPSSRWNNACRTSAPTARPLGS